jgi:universal stress protein E
MKSFKNILLVTDGKLKGKSGLSRLFTIVKNNDARITLVDVIDEIPSGFSLFNDENLETSNKARKEFQDWQVEKSRSNLSGIVEKLKSNGIRANAKVLKGKAFVEIIRTVLRNKHDLVITKVTEKAKAPILKVGDEGVQLMRNCPCPVLLGRDKVREDQPLILAAIDPDALNIKKNDLNNLILRHTFSLGQSFKKCEIHIVNVWDFHGQSSLMHGLQSLASTTIKTMSSREKRRRQELIEDIIDKYHGDKERPTIHVLKGDPKKVIPRLAKKLNAGIVLMGTVCRTGIPGLIVGNTAESVMSKLECSILAIKPVGFVSSVTLKKIKYY